MRKGEFFSSSSYLWRVSTRARRIRITVAPGGVVTIVRPRAVPQVVAERFVARKEMWLARAIERMRRVTPAPSPSALRADYRGRRAQALAFVVRRTAELNQRYGFLYRKVIVRNQRSRWGSCSRTGTLSFNYRILDLPQVLADYLIVHELCHLKEMNHSKRFWALVAQVAPDYRTHRLAIKRYLDKK